MMCPLFLSLRVEKREMECNMICRTMMVSTLLFNIREQGASEGEKSANRNFEISVEELPKQEFPPRSDWLMFRENRALLMLRGRSYCSFSELERRRGELSTITSCTGSTRVQELASSSGKTSTSFLC